ncbi:hypothetical protein GCM10027592_29100 [Spirosoma flavus]
MTNPFEELQTQLNRVESTMSLILGLLSKAQTAQLQVDESQPIQIEEASKLLGITVQTIYCNIGRIPHFKKHNRLYFYREQLKDYLSGKGADYSALLHEKGATRSRRNQKTLPD